MMPKEVFLSHSSANRNIADAFGETIRNHGIPIWYSNTNIKTAQAWHDEIGRALKRCDWYVVLLSPASCNSYWVKQELQYALGHAQYQDRIAPVIIEGCDYEELSWTLGNFQMANWENNQRDAYERVLRAWGVGLDDTLIVSI